MNTTVHHIELNNVRTLFMTFNSCDDENFPLLPFVTNELGDRVIHGAKRGLVDMRTLLIDAKILNKIIFHQISSKILGFVRRAL